MLSLGFSEGLVGSFHCFGIFGSELRLSDRFIFLFQRFSFFAIGLFPRQLRKNMGQPCRAFCIDLVPLSRAARVHGGFHRHCALHVICLWAIFWTMPRRRAPRLVWAASKMCNVMIPWPATLINKPVQWVVSSAKYTKGWPINALTFRSRRCFS